MCGLQVLLYGACDRPGPDKDDIAIIVQVTAQHSLRTLLLHPVNSNGTSVILCGCFTLTKVRVHVSELTEQLPLCQSGSSIKVRLHTGLVVNLQSGGGSVTKCEKPSGTLTRSIARGVQLAVMGTDKAASEPGVKQLLKAKVPCASASFLVDWLARPQKDLTEYLLFGSQIDWASELMMAEEARKAPVMSHQMSPQYNA